MILNDDDLAELTAIAVNAARDAGAFIARSRPRVVDVKDAQLSKAAQVVTDIDHAAETIIVNALSPTLDSFDLALLTEERDDDGERHRKDYFWCVDPLDGTLLYVEGKPGFAVSIALVERSGRPVIGVVFAPSTDELYVATAGRGAQRNGSPLRVVEHYAESPLHLFADATFVEQPAIDDVTAAVSAVADELGYDSVEIQVPGGSVLNGCRVLDRRPACMFKLPKPNPGGGSLWDFAATACLATEAGAVVTDIFGEALPLNQADSLFMNRRGVVYATDEKLAHALRHHLRPLVTAPFDSEPAPSL